MPKPTTSPPPLAPDSPLSHPDMKHIQRNLPTVAACCLELKVSNEGEETTVTHFLIICTNEEYLCTLLKNMTSAAVIAQVDEQKNRQRCSHKGATPKMVSAAVDQYAGTIDKPGIVYDALRHILATCKGLVPEKCWTAHTGVQLQLAACEACDCQVVKVITPDLAPVPFKQLLTSARAQLPTAEEWAHQLNTDHNLASFPATAAAAGPAPVRKRAAPAMSATKKPRTSSTPAGPSSLTADIAGPCMPSSGVAAGDASGAGGFASMTTFMSPFQAPGGTPGAYNTGTPTAGASPVPYGFNGLTGLSVPGGVPTTTPDTSAVRGLYHAPGGPASGCIMPGSNLDGGPAGTAGGVPTLEPGPLFSTDWVPQLPIGSVYANELLPPPSLEEDDSVYGWLDLLHSEQSLPQPLDEQGKLLPLTSSRSESDNFFPLEQRL